MGAFVISGTSVPVQSPVRGQSFWSKFASAFMKARQRAADREIARHLALNPGLMRELKLNGFDNGETGRPI